MMDIWFFNPETGNLGQVEPSAINWVAKAYPHIIYFYATLVAGEVRDEDPPVPPGGTDHDVREEGERAQHEESS